MTTFDKVGNMNWVRRPIPSLQARYVYQLVQLSFTGQALILSQTEQKYSQLQGKTLF